MTLRVGVNLLPLHPGPAGGVKQHVLGLLDRLLELNSDTKYIYYINDQLSSVFPVHNSRIRLVVCTSHGEIEARGEYGEFDVLYAPLMSLGISKPSFPSVIMLVDLQHITYPQYFSEEQLTNRRLTWEWGAKVSQKVCTSTNYVANTINKTLGVERNRIILTPPSIPKVFLMPSIKGVEEKFNQLLGNRLPEKFIFYPANTWPHKNHENLFRALKKNIDSGSEYSLVLTGWASNAHLSIKSTIKDLDLLSSIYWSGYIPDEWMPMMYNRADALIFPSLYEGFGIPLLEAMHTGCPIACSNVTSCPEICGDAALYFDPESIDQIADSIKEITESDETRSRLITSGFEQAKILNNGNSVSQLHDSFYDAVNEYKNPYKWNHNFEFTGECYSLNNSPEESPLVSVIVPSFNQGKYIKETIDSILSQNYPSIEILVIDGGSSDETTKILESYNDQIFWISEADNGQAHALNKGLMLAKGAVIGWLNSDDIYLPNAVEKAIFALKKQTGCSLVYGEAAYINEFSDKIGRYKTEPYSRKALLRHCIICQPSVFFKRQLMEIAGGANDSYEMALDYEMWLRFSKFTPLLFIPEELACSRMYPENKTSLYRRLSIKESMRACRDHYGRTSLLWCNQFAKVHSEHIPFLRKFKISRYPIQGLLFIYAVMKNEINYNFSFYVNRIFKIIYK